MLSAKRRRRAATVPGAGQDGGSRGAEARRSRAARTPVPGDHSPQVRGGDLAGGEATLRRGGVDRLAATLLYADRNTRMSSLRRRSPLTLVARLGSGPAGCFLGKVRTGVFSAPAVPRRIVDILDLLPADREARMVAEPLRCGHH